jgi:hypothetical protein
MEFSRFRWFFNNTWQINNCQSTNPAQSGDRGIVIFGSTEINNDFLYAPSITVSAGVSDQFSFWARSFDPTKPDSIRLLISIVPRIGPFPNFVNFTTVLDPLIAPPSGVQWYKYTYDLSAYVGQTIDIAFHSTTTNAGSFEIDTVISDGITPCAFQPVISSSAVTETSATISWTPPSIAPTNGYEYYYSTENIPPTNTTAISGTTGTGITSVALTGLTPNSSYYVWVRSVCSSTLRSEWSFSYSFFFTSLLPNCVTLISPANGDNNVEVQLEDEPEFPLSRLKFVNLQWANSPSGENLRGYNIYFGLSPDTMFKVNEILITENNINVYYLGFIDLINYNTTYYWSVDVLNEGVASGCNEIRSFTTGPVPSTGCTDGSTPFYQQPPVFIPLICDGVTENEIILNQIINGVPFETPNRGPGHYYKVSVTEGQTYKFQTTTTSNQILPDIITIAPDDSFIGLTTGQNPLVWTATQTGTVRFLCHLENCNFDLTYSPRNWSVVCGANLNLNNYDSENFKSYPNPVEDVLYLSYDKRITKLSVFNMLGQEVLGLKTNLSNTAINMANLAAGMYTVKIMSNNEEKRIRVIKE